MAVVSAASASVAVEKATSDLLIGPDWTMNIDICDSLNSNHWLAKDVVKAVKKRLQHKNSKVQLLALTLLETMVKNCGDFVHFQIAEKNILGEMVRIVKKKADMHVRDKILVLLDSWQEAFGGPGGKHPQYYWAYEDLRRSGVQFPQRSSDSAPIFTPPVAHSPMRHAQAGFGMPSNSSRRLDETMATEVEGLSLSNLDSMRNVMELLGDMLQAVNPDDREAVKDEIIVDLVNGCRSNQKKLMQMLTTTGDEELLGQGLDLNDSLQILLARHDSIASGNPMPTQVTSFAPRASEGSSSSSIKDTEVKQTEVKDAASSPSSITTMSVSTPTRSRIDEDEEEEDDFAQLARRHSKPQSSPSQTTNLSSKALVPVDASSVNSSTSPTSSIHTAGDELALALPDPPAPIKTTKEQDIIDFLSITLSTPSPPHQPQTPHTPSPSNLSMPQAAASNQTMPQVPAYPYATQTYPGNQGQAAYSSYVVPWAQPPQQQQSQFPSHPHLQPQIQQLHPQSQPQSQGATWPNQHFQPRPQLQEQFPPSSQLYSQMQPQPQQQFSPQSQSRPYSQLQPQPQPQSQSRPYSQLQTQSQPQHQSQTHSLPQAQVQPQQHFQPQAQAQPQQHFQPQAQAQPQQHFQPQAQAQPQQHFQPQLQSHYPQYSSAYPPPPWAGTPGYANGHTSTTTSMFSNAPASYTPAQASRPMQHSNSFSSRGSNALALNGSPRENPGPKNTASSGQKPFIPSYRLFEDLNVLGNTTDGRFGSTTSSLSGPSSQGMVGGRK